MATAVDKRFLLLFFLWQRWKRRRNIYFKTVFKWVNGLCDLKPGFFFDKSIFIIRVCITPKAWKLWTSFITRASTAIFFSCLTVCRRFLKTKWRPHVVGVMWHNPRKSWTQFNFCKNPREGYVRIRPYNLRKKNRKKKTRHWKLDNVESTHAVARVKFHFYVRLKFSRTLTCVDKHATVEIQLYSTYEVLEYPWIVCKFVIRKFAIKQIFYSNCDRVKNPSLKQLFFCAKSRVVSLTIQR